LHIFIFLNKSSNKTDR